jgi:predicted MPP superfamily phosphohydrolase
VVARAEQDIEIVTEAGWIEAPRGEPDPAQALQVSCDGSAASGPAECLQFLLRAPILQQLPRPAGRPAVPAERVHMIQLFVLVLLVHLYMGWRLLADMPFGLPGIVATVAMLGLSLSVLPFAEYARRNKQNPCADHLAGAGFLAMGFFSSLLILTLLRELVLLAGHAANGALIEPATFHAVRVWSAAAVPGLALFLSVAGYVNARRRAAIRTVEIPIAGLPESLHGFSIVQITDIHVGATIKHGYVSRIVDAVNSLEADMIAITGDLVDGSVGRLGRHTEPLGRLTARHGTFFVTGNHEYYSGAHAWIGEMRRLGLSVLLNEHVVLEHSGEAIVIAGVTDLSGHHFDPAHRSDPVAALAGAPEEAAVRVLLAHQPRSAYAASQAGFDLQLSGHTHGGQFFPWNYVVKLFEPFTAGLHRLDDLLLYVSRGTGYWGPPKRFGAPSEITHLKLVRA